MIKTYYRLAKPGIIYGNDINATAGFFLASPAAVNWGRLLAMLAGLSLIIGSACVFNNYIDRELDKKMARTKNRALAAGKVATNEALAYATALLLIGSTVLGVFTNTLALALALLGFVIYVFAYSPAKPRTYWATIIGSFAGAMPPVVGYTAVTGRIDWAALLLFLILIFWQMPHFYSIAIYRAKDYRSAGVPVLPQIKGVRAAKVQMAGYITAFTAASLLLTTLGYTGYVYALVVAAICFGWLRLALIGFNSKDNIAWARQMFKFSLLVTLVWAFMTAVGGRLP